MTPKKKTTQRGYGATHKQTRRMWQRMIEAGEAYCARCSLPIVSGQPWDLDHSDDRLGYLGPSHRSCNVGAANRRRAGTSRKRPDPGWTGIVPPPIHGVERWSRVW